MAYFTPTQEWIRGLWSQNAQDGNAGQSLMGPAQLDMPPMGANIPLPEAQPQMEQPQPQESPIAKGLEAGMSAGRKSMEADAQQKERLAGLMLFHMFSGLSGGGGKNKSVLGGLSEGLRQGMPHLQNERANIEKLNLMEMERQASIEKEMQRRKELQENRTDLNSYRNSLLELKKQETGMSKAGNNQGPNASPDFTPLSSFPKGAQTDLLKEMRERVATGLPLRDVLDTLDQMKKLSDKNPHLGESMAVAYFSDKDGKGLGNVLKNISLGKDRTAVEEFSKLKNVLIQKQIKSVKGIVSDRLKKIFLESTPSAGMTKESIDYLIKTATDEFVPYYEDALHARKGIQDKNYALIKLKPYQPPAEKKPMESTNQSNEPSYDELINLGWTPKDIEKVRGE